MKWQDAKRIPLTEVLARLGHHPTHTSAGGEQVWYISPLRTDTEPSFNVNTERPVHKWHDFGTGQGGTVIDFMMAYCNLTTVSEVLAKLEDMGYGDKPASLFEPKPKAASPAPPVEKKSGTITLTKVQPLQNKALIQYLEQRAIPVAVAREHVQEAYYTVAGRDRTYFALAFPNRAGGYELRNPYFQGVVGSKDISLMLPDNRDLFEVVVFEGFMDFLSARAHWKGAAPPTLVLNSVALKDRAITAIREHGFTHVRLYLDRDDSGRRLTREFQALDGLTVVDASGVYDGYKDFNDWLIACKQRERC